MTGTSGPPATMRAAVNTRYGGPDAVRIADVALPEPGEGEIRVRVRATTVNRTDVAYRRAHPFFVRLFTGLTAPKQPIGGTEVAGEVERLGPGSTRFAVGDRVFGWVESTFGAHAQYLVLPQDAPIETIPDGIDDAHAAAATEGAHYALSNMDAGGIGPGSRVMVYGASGSIGSAAVQLMVREGVTVTAVCGTDHVAWVSRLGADRVVDYQTEDFTADPNRYDVVFDSVGKTSYPICRHLLTPTGQFLATDFGPFPTNPGWALLTAFSRGRRVKLPVPGNSRLQVPRVREALADGSFVPVLDDRRFTLAQISDAHRYVDTGMKTGNVVVEVP